MRVEKLIDGQKNMSLESKTKWKENKRKQMLSRTPEQVKEQLMKQYATKRKNGTFNCTGIENKYAEMLDKQGINYIREFIIPEGGKRYRYDFYIPSEHMLVEVNGTGTHADPEKYMAEDVMKLGIPGWKVKTAAEIWKQDERKRVYAVKYGYNMRTIWEREL
jgi:very-short-patch-repair endonuclease